MRPLAQTAQIIIVGILAVSAASCADFPFEVGYQVSMYHSGPCEPSCEAPAPSDEEIMVHKARMDFKDSADF